MSDQDFDAAVAAWSRQQNHGVPPWHVLDEEGRKWWRERYALRHPNEGQESE